MGSDVPGIMWGRHIGGPVSDASEQLEKEAPNNSDCAGPYEAAHGRQWEQGRHALWLRIEALQAHTRLNELI